MRRNIVVLFLSVALLGLLQPGAPARPTEQPKRPDRAVSKNVHKSPKQIRSYWTKAKMRNAKPATAPSPKGSPSKSSASTAPTTGKPGSVAATAPASQTFAPKGPDRSYEVAEPYTNYPYSTHGKVFFTDPNTGANYVCSGTAINSANRSVVWTAGHCVNGGGAGQPWYTNWAFAPARKDGSNPFGLWTARETWSTAGWVNSGNIRYDMAAAVMNTNGGNALVDVVGGRGISWNQPRNQFYQSFGYPAAPPFGGERLRVCESQWIGDDNPSGGSGPSTMAIECDMTGGSSGGGWIVGGNVNGLNSYGYATVPNVMFGPYFDTGAANLYNAVQSL